MNPFTESTVARPLIEKYAAQVSFRPPVKYPAKRRSLVGVTLGAVGLATSLGMPAATGMTSTAALLARAGLVFSAIAPGLAHAIDVNSASQEQLQGMRGIGPKTAQIIIDERTRAGRYESFEDLSDRVKGIGPKKVASLQAAGLTLGPRASAVDAGQSHALAVPPTSTAASSPPGNRQNSRVDKAAGGKNQGLIKTGSSSRTFKQSP
ncbi:DUF655 domain-containing protein [Candidimonas sp. SYP-B2681]|uniref:ComEA family DNA-binding protein n=1 Tax=Candidimonas sp. SYP-B2681 TaxID=2497686 RepID=UPI000F895662|nr:DUF655 domain-containing protein [Candidimonas sp. SYP-B2681]RTZ40996.1 DUF655 domain-containing protein [Candidimonas sp. SYP-B2681]